MEIKYTKKGMEITHPTGFKQTITLAMLLTTKEYRRKEKDRIKQYDNELDNHILQTKNAKENLK